MNEILLAFVTFILGILATVVTQFFNRKLKLQEQRRQRRVEHLIVVQNWINSYRSLFRCKYPQLKELVLVHRYADPNYRIVKFDGESLVIVEDRKPFEQICAALREFKALEDRHKIIEKEAVFALRALGANTYKPNPIVLAVLHLRLKFLKYQYMYFIGDGFELWYPQGFLKEIAPRLLELLKQKDKLFYEFPRRIFYNINWELLENVEFEQFSRLLTPRHPKIGFPELPKFSTSPNSIDGFRSFLAKRDEYIRYDSSYTEDEFELIESLDSMELCRQSAERAIDDTLLIIEKYKTEWS